MAPRRAYVDPAMVALVVLVSIARADPHGRRRPFGAAQPRPRRRRSSPAWRRSARAALGDLPVAPALGARDPARPHRLRRRARARAAGTALDLADRRPAARRGDRRARRGATRPSSSTSSSPPSRPTPPQPPAIQRLEGLSRPARDLGRSSGSGGRARASTWISQAGASRGARVRVGSQSAIRSPRRAGSPAYGPVGSEHRIPPRRQPRLLEPFRQRQASRASRSRRARQLAPPALRGGSSKWTPRNSTSLAPEPLRSARSAQSEPLERRRSPAGSTDDQPKLITMSTYMSLHFSRMRPRKSDSVTRIPRAVLHSAGLPINMTFPDRGSGHADLSRLRKGPRRDRGQGRGAADPRPQERRDERRGRGPGARPQGRDAARRALPQPRPVAEDAGGPPPRAAALQGLYRRPVRRVDAARRRPQLRRRPCGDGRPRAVQRPAGGRHRPREGQRHPLAASPATSGWRGPRATARRSG